MDQFFNFINLTIFLSAFTLFSGFYLTFKGRPYNGLGSAVHKIVSLVLAALYIMVLFPLIKEASNAEFSSVLFYLTLLFYLLSLLSGAIVVNLKSKMALLLWSHRILPLLCFMTGIASWLMI